MSSNTEIEDAPRGGNNPAPRSSQNKPQLLQATMRNVPKLKELNYTQWKNIITSSIKNAKLWGYVDGSIEQPSEENASGLEKYYDEAGAVRNAILGSLDYGAQKYIEEAIDPREAWLTLEKKYLTAEADTDAKIVSIEKQLAELKLEEGGDIIEHITEFCRMRSQLNGTRFALDGPASVSMLYRSLPSSLRQSVVSSDGADMKDLATFCARLSYLSQNPEAETSADNTAATLVEDYTSWGVPADIKAFGLTGDKNSLLEERAAVTCRDCLLKDHKAGTPQCPQYEWRRELWGGSAAGDGESTNHSAPSADISTSAGKFIYKFSEPIKVVTSFAETGLKKELIQRTSSLAMTIPSAIQQCAIIPMINGRNVLAQAPSEHGKTTTLALSVLQSIDTSIPNTQIVVLAESKVAAMEIQNALNNLTLSPNGYGPNWAKCYLCDNNTPIGTDFSKLAFEQGGDHVVLGTPTRILELVRRGILQTRYLKILAIDNIERVLEAGFNDQVLELRRCLPGFIQTIVTFTTSSSGLFRTASDLMANPLHITVEDNSVFFYARHFFLVFPKSETRMNNASRIANTFSSYYGSNTTWIMRSTMPTSQCDQQMRSFLSSSYSGCTLITTDSASLTRTKVVNQPNIPLIHYHAPSNPNEYAKRFAFYGGSGKITKALTLIAAETDEIRVVHEIEEQYGIKMMEMSWDGNNFG